MSSGSSAQWLHLAFAEGHIRLLPRNAAMKNYATSHLSTLFYSGFGNSSGGIGATYSTNYRVDLVESKE